jgi:hypothetical protein
MDRILKVVYDNWFDETTPFANGFPQEFIHQANTTISRDDPEELIDQQITARYRNFTSPFRPHNNFFRYFKKHFPNQIVSPDAVNDADIYLYPIEAVGLNALKSSHQSTVAGTDIEYSIIDTINPVTLNNIINGRVKLVINFIHDPINLHTDIIPIENYFAQYGIVGHNIIIVAGHNFPDLTGTTVHVIGGNLFFTQGAEELLSFPTIGSLGYHCDCVRAEDLNDRQLRNKKFISFNRNIVGRHHREALAYLAVKHNFVNDSIFSFLEKPTVLGIKSDLLRLFSYVDHDLVQQVYDLVPIEIDTHTLPSNQKTSFATSNNQKELYLDSYINLVTETRFIHGTDPFISEKTFRPIINLQPFLMFGNYHTLRKLRDYGFKTFGPFIDESYDEETDPVKRMDLLEQEIKKLAGMDINQIHTWYHSIIDVLVYNQQHLKTFVDYNPYHEVFQRIQNLN